MVKLGNGAMVLAVASKKVGLFRTQFEIIETGICQGSDACIVLPSQKIPLGQLNSTNFLIILVQFPPVLEGSAALQQIFLNTLPGRSTSFKVQTVEY